MSESLRRRAGFKKHLHSVWPGRRVDRALNLLVAPGEKTPKWISDISHSVPEWRADVRDVYLRWAITINAMHVAKERYASKPDIGLETKTLRTDRAGNASIQVLDTWTATDTARNYELATPLLAAYGFADLYGLFEEIVFEMYLIYLNENPDTLLFGEEYRPLRRAYKNRNTDKSSIEKWEVEWAERLSKWRRKRGYDGLNKVFASFWRDAGLKRPSDYNMSDVDDWCHVIQAIGELRNLITHGVGEVTPELATFSRVVPSNVFAFEEGEQLEVDITHLMFLECFLDQMMHTIGASVLERAFGPVLNLKP